MRRAADLLPAARPIAPVPDELRRYYEEGQLAGATGRPLDDCPRYRQDRAAAWRRGWHDGKAQREEFAEPALTEAEIARAEAGLAQVRAVLGDLGEAGPFWSRQYRTDATLHLWREAGRSACGYYWWPSHRERRPIEAAPSVGPDRNCPDCLEWHNLWSKDR
jgi:ribosome modulation factor